MQQKKSGLEPNREAMGGSRGEVKQSTEILVSDVHMYLDYFAESNDLQTCAIALKQKGLLPAHNRLVGHFAYGILTQRLQLMRV